MTTILKLLSVLLCAELVMLGNLVLVDHELDVARQVPAKMAISDVIDIPVAREATLEEEVVPEEESGYDDDVLREVEAQPEDDWQDYQEWYGYAGDYTDEECELVPYDGSGHYNANLDGSWHEGSEFVSYGKYGDGSGYSYTYYSEKVLPGGGLDIPGRHVGDEGYVCDGDGNICIASDDLPYGTVVDVPFGSGTAVVYDSGSGHGNLDVYVSW